jgi:hypothetical protein
VNGHTVSKSSSTTVTKTKKGKKTTANGAVIEYETSGNVESVEFDPSNMNQGFHMEFNTTQPTVTHTTTSPAHGTMTVTQTVSTPTHTVTTTETDVNAQAVAHAAMAGVASLFAPKPQVIIKETVYVPAPTQQIVYQAPKPQEPEEERWECTTWEEGECCCFKRMDPEKAKRYNKYASSD